MNVYVVGVALHGFMDTLEAFGGEPYFFRFDGLDRRSR